MGNMGFKTKRQKAGSKNVTKRKWRPTGQGGRKAKQEAVLLEAEALLAAQAALLTPQG